MQAKDLKSTTEKPRSRAGGSNRPRTAPAPLAERQGHRDGAWDPEQAASPSGILTTEGRIKGSWTLSARVDYRIEITVSEHGRFPENGERIVRALADFSPDSDAVASQNTETGNLSVVFFQSHLDDVNDALEDAFLLFVRGAKDINLEPSEVLDVHCSVVPEETRGETSELQPVGA